MRLPRSRRGKTPIDVGVVTQEAGPRVRLSIGEDGMPGRKNSDLDKAEVDALVTFLLYHGAKAFGGLEPDEPEPSADGA